jgi:hypothetical protein
MQFFSLPIFAEFMQFSWFSVFIRSKKNEGHGLTRHGLTRHAPLGGSIFMGRCRWVLALVIIGLPWLPATGNVQSVLGLRPKLHKVNMKLHGQVLDFTNNHGQDNRLWSPALQQKRDLYVYLPPNFDPARRYPLAIFLHGATQDEQFFLQKPVELFDQAIARRELPPVIIAIPDGSIQGRPSFFQTASFFANTRAGNFGDYIMQDVWNFLMENFPIRPEREAHAILGVSMGGSAAFAHAMNNKDRVKIAVGFVPAVNLRWVDCHGRYAGKFHPDCWGFREYGHPMEIIGRPGLGLVKIRFHVLFGPIAGRGREAPHELSRINPLEIMERTNLKDGELDLYIGYGGKDEFNIDAHVESFLHVAKEREISVAVDYDPEGRHDLNTGIKLFPAAIRWVAPLVAPYFLDDDPLPAPKSIPE